MCLGMANGGKTPEMTEKIKEMVYQINRLNPPERIASGEYKGFWYYVLNLGTHPCAYIDVTETELNSVDYCNIDVACHGGLTYSRQYLATVDKKGWFIGWDYAHYGDFVGYEMLYPDLQSNDKKWTTEKVVKECKDVIDRVIELLESEQQ